MKRRTPLFFAAAAAVLLSAGLYGACGGGGNETTTAATSTGTPGGSGGAGGAGGEMGSGGTIFTDGGVAQFESIVIEPQSPVIEIVNGVIPAPVTFQALGVTASGDKVPVSGGSWSFDRFDVASVNTASGALTPTGFVGGIGTVTYKDPSQLSATTNVTVKLRYISDPAGLGPTSKPAFDVAAANDPAMALLYPYNKTVFPRGLAGPTVQWNGGNPGDIYYIRASSPTFLFEGYSQVPPPSRYDFPKDSADIWKKLTDSTTGDIAFTVQRFDGAVAYLPVAQTWTIAPANLTGFIYYWEVNTGNVVRIAPGSTAPEYFIQKPANVSCVACHSVSKDGSKLVASFHGGYSPWGTFDAKTGAALYDSGFSSGFQAISPNGSHVLWRHWNDAAFNGTGYLTLSPFDSAVELAQLNPGAGQPSHPAWSGDATKIAFSVRTDGNGLDFTQSTLWVTDVDLGTNTFANTKKIVDNDAARPTVTFPTFSADSKWIAFERSTQARSREAKAEIWLTNLDGSIQMPLDATNGVGVLQGEQLSASYEPTFMPVAAGGYFWLVVVSERQYGNTLTDTNPLTRRKQLWVSAIDASPAAGQDPSHPGFWLPGQGLDNQNMRGEWALSPCKQIGEGCAAGYECCDGFCHDDGMGNQVCSDKPGACSLIGEACTTAADCCDANAICLGGFCAKKDPT
jgi:hypothetical protein